VGILLLFGLLLLVAGMGLVWYGPSGKAARHGLVFVVVGALFVLGSQTFAESVTDPNPVTSPPTLSTPTQAITQEPAARPAARPGTDWRVEEARVRDEAERREREESAGAQRRAEAERAEAQRVQAEAQARLAGEKQAEAAERAERAELAMLEYEIAKAEHHAARKLHIGRTLATDAKSNLATAPAKEYDRLLLRSQGWYKEVNALYPDTQAAADARQLLNGKKVPIRPAPPAPSLPPEVKASDEDIRETAVAQGSPTSATTTPVGDQSTPVAQSSDTGSVAWSPGTVAVRGYYRKDGTYVRPHQRTKADHTTSNNRSHPGNANTSTGRKGTRR
jgi:hypothetical protein